MAGGGGPSSGTVEPPLSQAYGYGIVVGLGFLFALGMIFTTYVLKKYNYEKQTSEMFNTAGRTVKSGLVASAVVSSWTWAATLLQSSGVAYRYGVSGPFWVRCVLRVVISGWRLTKILVCLWCNSSDHSLCYNCH
jgi:Na+/proline symporter